VNLVVAVTTLEIVRKHLATREGTLWQIQIGQAIGDQDGTIYLLSLGQFRTWEYAALTIKGMKVELGMTGVDYDPHGVTNHVLNICNPSFFKTLDEYLEE
jgi:hypothetical protein